MPIRSNARANRGHAVRQSNTLASPAVCANETFFGCPEDLRGCNYQGATWTFRSYLSRTDEKLLGMCETAPQADPLGPAGTRRSNTFRLPVGQGQGKVRNGGWTCDLGN